jgi:multiple antibiotic resistance protein
MVDYFFVPENFPDHLLRSTITLLVVLNPIGIVPIFIGMTRRTEVIKRKELFNLVVITASGLLFVFAVAGTQIFSVFGISVASFMVAGGILLFAVAIELLTGGFWARMLERNKEWSACIPSSGRSRCHYGRDHILGDYGLAGDCRFDTDIYQSDAVLRSSERIYRVLGKRGSLIVTRVFAVLVVA